MLDYQFNLKGKVSMKIDLVKAKEKVLSFTKNSFFSMKYDFKDGGAKKLIINKYFILYSITLIVIIGAFSSGENNDRSASKAVTSNESSAYKDSRKSEIRIKSKTFSKAAPLNSATTDDKIANTMMQLSIDKNAKNDPVLAREVLVESFNKYGYNLGKTAEAAAKDLLNSMQSSSLPNLIMAYTSDLTEGQINNIYTKDEAKAILNLNNAMNALHKGMMPKELGPRPKVEVEGN
jgi:hypothetical protein